MKKINKKGNVEDIIFGVVMLFVIIICLFAIMQCFDKVAISINSSDTISPVTKDDLNVKARTLPSVMDSTYLIVFVGVFISIIVSAYIIRSNMLFLFIALILLAIFIVISAALSNIVEGYVNDPNNIDYMATHFQLSQYMILHYPLFVMGFGMLILIILYGKIQSGGGGGMV